MGLSLSVCLICKPHSFSCLCLPRTSITSADHCTRPFFFFFNVGGSHADPHTGQAPSQLSCLPCPLEWFLLASPDHETAQSLLSLSLSKSSNSIISTSQPSQRLVHFSGASRRSAYLPAVPLNSPCYTQPSEPSSQTFTVTPLPQVIAVLLQHCDTQHCVFAFHFVVTIAHPMYKCQADGCMPHNHFPHTRCHFVSHPCSHIQLCWIISLGARSSVSRHSSHKLGNTPVTTPCHLPMFM